MTWVGWRLLGLGGKGKDSKALELGGVNADKGNLGRSLGSLRGAMGDEVQKRNCSNQSYDQLLITEPESCGPNVSESPSPALYTDCAHRRIRGLCK